MFALGTTSLSRLEGVHPDLVRVVHRAITLTDVDFSVVEGRRTPARQRELVAAGASQTLDSRHLTGHAVDLAPWVAGGLRWDWPAVFRVADAVFRAARLEAVAIRWGGAWDWDSAGTQMMTSAERLSEAYVARRQSRGQRAFLDGPHFELPRHLYPEVTS
jgi:peptidoglycan LD-endopeptidase CwlK